MSKVLWSTQQKQDFDEWALHFETYQKWLTKKPQEHQLYHISINHIKKKCSVEYYRGFLEAIAHMIAVIQNSLESAEAKKEMKQIDLKRTFAEYCNVLLGYLSLQNLEKKTEKKPEEELEEGENDEHKIISLLETAERAVPTGKSIEFYQGFRDGCEQMSRLVAMLYDEKKPFQEPFNVLKTIFIIQSGYSIGLMIENWPKERIPRYQRHSIVYK